MFSSKLFFKSATNGLHFFVRYAMMYHGDAQMSFIQTQKKDKCIWRADMEGTTVYFVVKQRALPEVLLKVVEANRLIDTRKAASVQDAVEMVGISRSSYYKYKDDIFPFHDSAQGTTLTMSCQMDDEPGLLSDVLKVVADFRANILTIHQSIPINGIASLSLSIQILDTTGDISEMILEMEKREGVHNVKVLARE